MPIELKEFLVNLKNWSFEFAPYKIDENEARKIIYALEQTELKMLSLEKFSGRNKGRWIHAYDSDGYESITCSMCGTEYGARMSAHNYCPYCGARMESD